MTAEVRGVGLQPQGIGAAQQHEKHANQIEHFAFRDRETALLSEDGMDLRHCPPFPEPPVANLDNDFQGEAAAAYRQAAGLVRDIYSGTPSALPIWAPVSHAHHQVTTAQKDDVLVSNRVTASQDLPTLRTADLLGAIVTLRDMSLVFSSSHHSPLWRRAQARAHFIALEACR
jgi:hypothetical protein